jgi:hypothetical protein
MTIEQIDNYCLSILLSFGPLLLAKYNSQAKSCQNDQHIYSDMITTFP